MTFSTKNKLKQLIRSIGFLTNPNHILSSSAFPLWKDPVFTQLKEAHFG